MTISELRREYHRHICEEIIRVNRQRGYLNFADSSSEASIRIASEIAKRMGYAVNTEVLAGQTIGERFERITQDFLEAAFHLLQHLRPGNWLYSTQSPISDFDQYEHLAALKRIIQGNNELESALGRDYIITPDIVVGRRPVTDLEINAHGTIVDLSEPVANLTSFREANFADSRMLLHASISCKWTIRSDRSQNARTEALNLIRNRKGHVPHIVSVIAEPLPTRLASLALGTGDLDCVYHFALHELQATIAELNYDAHSDMLRILVEGRRLRDISDLPFDLAI
ncbi:MAG: restriction endonuclease [Chloroflexi bacterium]|nr:restriction endonuclease [Chloroflexota bacterium]